MSLSTVSLPVLPTNRPLRLTPTDVSQFVRLEQCERFLRFRLGERDRQKFMKDYDVTPQRITPLLSLSGHEFEEGIEKALGRHFRTVHYADCGPVRRCCGRVSGVAVREGVSRCVTRERR